MSGKSMFLQFRFSIRDKKHGTIPSRELIFNTIFIWARWLKRQRAWLRAGRPGFDRGCRRGGDFSSLLRVQIGPGVHSNSYKMSTGEFPRG